MKKILYMHCGSGNHGCEALVRTTSALLGGPKNVRLWSFGKAEDEYYKTSECLEYVIPTEELGRFTPAYFEALFKRKILRQPHAIFDVFLKKVFRGNIAVSIGGDNYCYPWSAQDLVEWNAKIRKHAKATVLWGCSIDEEAITPEVKKDLAAYDLITARETITYNFLKEINPNTQLVADSAFLLETTYNPLPAEFIEGNTVGVNVSPLIMKYGTEGELILQNYAKMIQHILDNTDMSVALIPHVVWEGNDDREPLKELYEQFKSTGRICLIEDADATVIKGYIARCRFFIGARTHATIAAYSSLVPTLVVGYSVKARGIAKDLFGDSENYVLPVQSLVEESQLTDAVDLLLKNEAEVKKTLTDIIPAFKERAQQARKFFNALI